MKLDVGFVILAVRNYLCVGCPIGLDETWYELINPIGAIISMLDMAYKNTTSPAIRVILVCIYITRAQLFHVGCNILFDTIWNELTLRQRHYLYAGCNTFNFSVYTLLERYHFMLVVLSYYETWSTLPY